MSGGVALGRRCAANACWRTPFRCPPKKCRSPKPPAACSPCRSQSAAHPAAGRCLGDGRLRGARRRRGPRAGAAEGDRRGRGGPALRRSRRSRRSGAHFHRRRDAARRRRRRDPGEHQTRRRPCRMWKSASAKGRHIRVAGPGLRKAGDELFAAGHRLTARDLALAAGMNHPLVPVHRRPKVALFATGDELVPPGSRAGARPDRLLQRLMRSARWRAPKAPHVERSRRSSATGLTTPIAAVRRARERRRRYPGHDRRRFRRRIRSRAKGVHRRGHGRSRSGGSRCGPAARS